MSRFNLGVTIGLNDRFSNPIQKVSNRFAQFEGRASKVQRALNQSRAQLNSISGFKKLKTEVISGRHELAEKQKRIGELSKKIRATETPAASLVKEFKELRSEAGRSKVALASKAQKLEMMRRNLHQAGISTKQLGGHQRRLRSETDRLTRSLEAMARKAAATKNLADSKIGSLAQNFAAPITMAGASAYVASQANQELDFGRHLAAVSVTADFNVADEANAKRRILELSSFMKTNLAPETLLIGLDTMVTRGLAGNTALAMLEDVGVVAKAGNAQIEDIGNTVFSLNQSLKITPKEMRPTLEALTSLGKMGAFELKNMAQYFPEITALARSMGMQGKQSAIELGSALQVAMLGAGDPSKAATNFINFMSKMTHQETTRRFQKQYGIDLEFKMMEADVAGISRFDAMINLIKDLTGGNQFRIGELFGDMQVVAFLTPMLQNLEKFEEMKEKANLASGVINQDYWRQMGTGREILTGFTNEISRFTRGIVSGMVPAIQAVFTPIASILSPINRAIERFPIFGQIIGSLVVGGLVAMATIAIPMVIAGLKTLGVVLMANPILLTAGLIGAGVALILANWKRIVSAGKVTIDFIKKYFGWTPIGMILNNWGMVKGFFKNLWMTITFLAKANMKVLAKVWEFSPFGMIQKAWKFLAPFFEQLTNRVNSSLDKVKARVNSFLGKIPFGPFIKEWNRLIGWFASGSQAVKGRLNSLKPLLNAVFNFSSLGLLIRGIRILFNALKPLIILAFNLGKQIATLGKNLFLEKMSKAWEAWLPILQKAWGFLKKFLAPVALPFLSLLDRINKGFSSINERAEKLNKATIGFDEQAAQKLTALLTQFSYFAIVPTLKLPGRLFSALGTLKSWIESKIFSVVTKLESAWDRLWQKVEKVTSFIQGKLSGISKVNPLGLAQDLFSGKLQSLGLVPGGNDDGENSPSQVRQALPALVPATSQSIGNIQIYPPVGANAEEVAQMVLEKVKGFFSFQSEIQAAETRRAVERQRRGSQFDGN